MKNLVLFLLLFSSQCYSQYFKVYEPNELDTFSGFNDIIINNEETLILGGNGAFPTRSTVFASKVDQFGALDNFYINDSDSTYQVSASGSNKLQINHDNNFVSFITTLYDDRFYIKLSEFNLLGEKIKDSLFVELLQVNNIFPSGKIEYVFDSQDSSYILLIDSREVTGPNNYVSKLVVLKLSKEFEVLQLKTMQMFPTGNKMSILGDIHIRNNGNYLINYSLKTNTTLPAQSSSIIIITELDENLDIVNNKMHADSDVCYGGFGIIDLDTAVIFGVNNSIFNGQNLLHNLELVCFNLSSGDLVWKKEIVDYIFTGYSYESSINEILLDDEFNIIYTYNSRSSEINDLGIEEYKYYCVVQKRDLNGNLLWSRSYKHNIEDEIIYITHKMIQTNEGYAGCGISTNYTRLIKNEPFYLGFAFSINCIGYIDSAKAELNVNQNNEFVEFTNMSSNYHTSRIDFGDGVSYFSDEYNDTLFNHTYTQPGTYTFSYTSYGCGNDSNVYEKTITVFSDEIDENETSFSIYPIPVISSNELTLEISELIESPVVFIHDLNGKLVLIEDKFLKGSNNKISLIKLAAGIYTISLTDKGSNFIEVKKLVVQ